MINFMIKFSQLSHELSKYKPFDVVEANALTQISNFVMRVGGGENGNFLPCIERTTLEGHLTASAWVIDKTKQFALLLHHSKLNLWLQPGGHIDAEDGAIDVAARRELAEESGLIDVIDAHQGLFDVDAHNIPARNRTDVATGQIVFEPAHWHYDLRFAFIAPEPELVKISDESQGFRWVSIVTLLGDDTEPSIRRLAQKTAHL
jgi:8-oxo-dGTP pyrophosphatase MutT (NUDIX family)